MLKYNDLNSYTLFSFCENSVFQAQAGVILSFNHFEAEIFLRFLLVCREKYAFVFRLGGFNSSLQMFNKQKKKRRKILASGTFL